MKPFFNKEPTDLTVLTGQTVQFYCSVGGDPAPQIIWHKGKTICNYFREIWERAMQFVWFSFTFEYFIADDGSMPVGR